MSKDAKGHGSAKRTYAFKDGDKSYTGKHSSFENAHAAARHSGLKDPSGGLKESKATQAANRKKAIEVHKSGGPGKIVIGQPQAKTQHGALAQRLASAINARGVRATTKNRKY